MPASQIHIMSNGAKTHMEHEAVMEEEQEELLRGLDEVALMDMDAMDMEPLRDVDVGVDADSDLDGGTDVFDVLQPVLPPSPSPSPMEDDGDDKDTDASLKNRVRSLEDQLLAMQAVVASLHAAHGRRLKNLRGYIDGATESIVGRVMSRVQSLIDGEMERRRERLFDSLIDDIETIHRA